MPGTTPIVGDLLQIRVSCRAAEQLSLNVLHYAVEAVVGGGLTLLQLADTFSTSVSGQYRNWMPVSAAYEGVTVQNVTPPITDPRESALGAGAGTSPGKLLPRQASGLISTLTGFGGRPNRGRVYVGLLVDSLTDANGNLLGAGTAQLQTLADALGPLKVLTVGGTSTSLRLTVRHPNTLPPVVQPQFTPVTALVAQGKIATQRRRGDYGSPNVS